MAERKERVRLNLYLESEVAARLKVVAQEKYYGSAADLAKRFIKFGLDLAEQEHRDPQDGDYYIKMGEGFDRPLIF